MQIWMSSSFSLSFVTVSSQGWADQLTLSEVRFEVPTIHEDPPHRAIFQASLPDIITRNIFFYSCKRRTDFYYLVLNTMNTFHNMELQLKHDCPSDRQERVMCSWKYTSPWNSSLVPESPVYPLEVQSNVLTDISIINGPWNPHVTSPWPCGVLFIVLAYLQKDTFVFKKMEINFNEKIVQKWLQNRKWNQQCYAWQVYSMLWIIWLSLD